MRFVFGSMVLALVLVSSALLGDGRAAGLTQAPRASFGAPLVHEAKIVCGNFGNGFTCRNQSGTVHRPKGVRPPGAASGETSGGTMESGDPDALPPASGDAGASSQAPNAVPTSCAANSELLGGHCIPYTQTCRKGLAAAAPPQVCRGAEEKLICDFRPDGLKDCCCRTYSKF